MTTIYLSPEESLRSLATLSDQYEEAQAANMTQLAYIADTKEPFTSGPSFANRMWPNKPQTTIETQIGETRHRIVVTKYDQESNLEALRMLFRSVLSLDKSHAHRTLGSEECMGKAVNVALQVDTEKSDRSCSKILNEHIRACIASCRSLEELDNFITGTSTALALSIDMAQCLQKKDVSNSLLDATCVRAAELCSHDSSEEMGRFSSIIRKLFDTAVVAAAQHLRADHHLTMPEKQAILQANWKVMSSIFVSRFKSLPPWAMRCVDLQGTASLLKAVVAIDLPNLQKGIEILLEAAQRTQNIADRKTYLSALHDLQMFLENTMQRTVPIDKKLTLDSLLHRISETIKMLKTPIELRPQDPMSTKEKTWKVAKKVLFDVADGSHKVISSALSGALSGALIGLINGQGLPGMAAGALGGAAAQGGTAVLALGINPLVNQIPCSPTRRATIRHHLTSWILPLISFFASLRISAWASRRFSHASAPIPVEQTSVKPQVPQQDGNVREQITISVPRDVNVQQLVQQRAPTAIVQAMSDSWQTKTVTVDVPRNQSASLFTIPEFVRIEPGQERMATLVGSIWDAIFSTVVASSITVAATSK